MPDPSEIPAFAVEARPGPDGRTTLAPVGELDISVAPAFFDAVEEHLRAGPVFLDLSGLLFMDSSGVAALDRLMRICAREGWEMLVGSKLDRQVWQILDLTGMLGVLPFDGEVQV